MERKKLHRIVGLLVIAAIVVIILPLVTERNEGPASNTLSVEAPPFPSTEASADSENAAPADATVPATPAPSGAASAEQPPGVTPPAGGTPATAAPSSNEDSAAAPQTPAPASKTAAPSAPATTSEAKPVRTERVVPGQTAWAVQMGNFHNHDNAIRLVNRLRAAGFRAFTREITAKNGVVSTRVYVGPASEFASAKKLSGDIHDQMNLEGIVISYRPWAL